MMMNILSNEDISVLDRQVEQLMEFKPIPEHEVKMLCEKVRRVDAFSDTAHSFPLFIYESSILL